MPRRKDSSPGQAPPGREKKEIRPSGPTRTSREESDDRPLPVEDPEPKDRTVFSTDLESDSGRRVTPMEFEEIEDEDTYFLRELDRLYEELSPRTPTSKNPEGPGTAPPSVGDRVLLPNGPESLGEPSPYLEERLTIARSAVSELVTQSRGVGRSLQGLRNALATIDRELDRASAEIGFLRSERSEERDAEGVSGRASSLDFPGPRPLSSTGIPTEISTPVDPPTISGSFEDFTLSRYNQTVGDLHARQRALGWGTVVAASCISSILLFLTLQAREPVPVLWLAVLPLVWMIPVPFFVAAFRGTQRVLRRNRLELTE